MARISPAEFRKKFTPREWDCLRLRCKGYTNAGVAYQLSIEIHTVRNHIANGFKRSDLRSVEEFCYNLGVCDEHTEMNRLAIEGKQ